MISKDKQYKTRQGQEVRIYSIDGYGFFPIHGAFLNDNGWVVCNWGEDGMIYASREAALDLIEIVPKVKVWIEYYLDRYGNFCVQHHKEEEEYFRLKIVGKQYSNLTHLKLDVFEYEPKPETK
jgi:hypothetical protein